MDVINPLVAQSMGFKCYREFDINDESTYARLCEDAYRYFIDNPAIIRYYCWIPIYGIIFIKRNWLGGNYAVA